jgi:hypothetical protein
LGDYAEMLSESALSLYRLHVARHGDVKVDDSIRRNAPTANWCAPG